MFHLGRKIISFRAVILTKAAENMIISNIPKRKKHQKELELEYSLAPSLTHLVILDKLYLIPRSQFKHV